MISKEYKAIFIHIHKTGGTSIEKKLGLFDEFKRGVQDHRKLREIERLAGTVNSLKYFLYYTYRMQPSRSLYFLKNSFSPELTREEYRTFFKFSFVRNTWARIFSWYTNVMEDDAHRQKYGIDENCGLHEFILKLDHRAFNQLDYLKNNSGQIKLDFIGRFENLQNDFELVCSFLGIEDKNLPRILIAPKRNYQDFYDQETRGLVAKLYEEEISYFKFEYGE